MEDVNKQRRNFISLSELEYGPLNTHVQYTQTDTIRQTDGPLLGTNGTIGTNRKAPYSNGSIGEYASH